MIIFSGIALFLVVAAIYGIVTTIREGYGNGNLVATIVCAVVAALLTTCVVFGIKEGPTTTYKATVTDYNEVYNAGYKIMRTDGKIVTLTKEVK